MNDAVQAAPPPAHAPIATAPLVLMLRDAAPVSVCLAFTDLSGPALERAAAPLLWKHEQARADRFLRAGARADFLRGRLAAKTALSDLGETPAASLNLENGVFRQPVVAAPFGHLGVSLSHGADGAIAAAYPGHCPMGVDLERVDADRIKVLRTQIPRAEEQTLCTLGLTPVQALTAAWSAREALSKVLGGGLSIDMAMLALEPKPDVKSDSKSHQNNVKTAAKYLKLNSTFASHLSVDVWVSDTAALALALPRTATCDWPVGADGAADPIGQWLTQLDQRAEAVA